VIGEDAVEARLGGYSGPGIDKVSILRGIQNISGDSIKVNFTKGCGREAKEFSVIPSQYLSVHSDGKQISGLKGEYFNNIDLQGDAVVTRIDPKIDFRWTLFSPDPEKINYDWFSVRWTGILKAPGPEILK
jgi:beta-glucosidase